MRKIFLLMLNLNRRVVEDESSSMTIALLGYLIKINER